MNLSSKHIVAPAQQRQLAERAALTSPENPWPLSLLSEKMKEYIERMSPTWIEAEVTEYRPRPSTRMSFFKIRDLNDTSSATITAYPNVMAQMGADFQEGARIITCVKPTFWRNSGSLQLHASDIYVVGQGNLLAEIERLRQKLHDEGLFSAERKQPLPFLPKRIGLVCGRNAKAKEDVLVNAKKRWPATDFEIREVAVQGLNCVREVCAAVTELDEYPEVEVIIVTRGGGSVEDLLPFSDEHLVRTVAACHTPIVSAIGHEDDTPLLDWVADYRASTPTDAAKKIVPDYWELSAQLQQLAERLQGALTRKIQRERENLELLASRPALVNPGATLQSHLQILSNLQTKLEAITERKLQAERTNLEKLGATLRAVSPESTLARGYAILRTPAQQVITDASTLRPKDLFEGILAQGSFVGQVCGTNPDGKLVE